MAGDEQHDDDREQGHDPNLRAFPDDVLRAVIEELAPIARLPTSPGERRAAERINGWFRGLGLRSEVEQVPAFSSYALPIGLLSGVGVVAAVAALRGHRRAGMVGGVLAAAGIVDDISGGVMACRRVFLRRRVAHNVVAEIGGANANRVVCVLCHHDAAPSGFVFRQDIETWLAEHHPDVIAKMRSNPPLWWLVIAGPAAVSLGALTRRRVLCGLGLFLGLGSLAAMIDIARRPAVPGANDNLSGVAAVVALAHSLSRRPPDGIRVILVCAGAEEALQEGIRGFARRHFGDLACESTWFVNLDTIGSGRLVLLEGEGPVRMHHYDTTFKDVVATCAARLGIPLIRGMSARTSTDGVVPSRHGYPTVTLVSVDHRNLLPNYHLDSDVPERVDYSSIRQAVELVDSLVRDLAGPITARR
jgi:acetylornithine deacetylase/succinyl-diaminopimelate desuccinylase-like protein